MCSVHRPETPLHHLPELNWPAGSFPGTLNSQRWFASSSLTTEPKSPSSPLLPGGWAFIEEVGITFDARVRSRFHEKDSAALERERLLGFGDGHTAVLYTDSPSCALEPIEAQRCAWLDAVPQHVASWLFENDFVPWASSLLAVPREAFIPGMLPWIPPCWCAGALPTTWRDSHTDAVGSRLGRAKASMTEAQHKWLLQHRRCFQEFSMRGALLVRTCRRWSLRLVAQGEDLGLAKFFLERRSRAAVANIPSQSPARAALAQAGLCWPDVDLPVFMSAGSTPVGSMPATCIHRPACAPAGPSVYELVETVIDGIDASEPPTPEQEAVIWEKTPPKSETSGPLCHPTRRAKMEDDR